MNKRYNTTAGKQFLTCKHNRKKLVKVISSSQAVVSQSNVGTIGIVEPNVKMKFYIIFARMKLHIFEEN